MLDDLMKQRVQLLGGGRLHGLVHRPLVGGDIDAVEKKAVQMNIQIGGRPEALYERDRTGLCLGACEVGLFDQKGGDGAIDHPQDR